MALMTRNVEQAARDDYELIIIGGGVYGSMLLLEATRAGIRAIMLEKDDFGGLTSFNSLRIVHGGLRYLQSLHFSRIFESVAERSWFLEHFPDLVSPMPCMMPLYSDLTKNRLTLRAALRMNDWLTRKRNDGLPPDQQIPDGHVIDAAETIERFPMVRKDGLKGAALWYDAVMPDSNRVLMEVLRWASSAGGSALNYVEAIEVLQADGAVRGVVVKDTRSSAKHEIRAPWVINAAGPDCRAVARQFAVDNPSLFRPSVAWNMLLERPPLSNGAIAVRAPGGDSRIYFAHSLGGKLFVGTGHSPVDKGRTPRYEDGDVRAMLADLSRAIPGLDATQADVEHVFWGQLPAKRHGTVKLAGEPLLINHGKHGGPEGLFSISGVKFTTARSAASRLLAEIRGGDHGAGVASLPERPRPATYELHPDVCADRDERMRRARALIENEAPQSLVDLLIRRSNLVTDRNAAMSIAADCCAAFGWDPEESSRQVAELSFFFKRGSNPAER